MGRASRSSWSVRVTTMSTRQTSSARSSSHGCSPPSARQDLRCASADHHSPDTVAGVITAAIHSSWLVAAVIVSTLLLIAVYFGRMATRQAPP
jgi:hypothetical protein